MLLVDLPRASQTERARRVCVLGSCRLRNPISALAYPDQMHLVLREPPFSHTVAEAQQVLDYARGRIEIPAELAPFIYGTDQAPSTINYPRFLAEDVDIFVVEIATQLLVRYRDYVFQQNQFNRRFLQHYGAPLLKWNRALAARQPISEEIIQESLHALAEAGHEITPLLEDMLRNVRMEWQDATMMAEQMRRLMFDTGRRWIMVSHFVIPGDAGRIMKDRAALNIAVAAAAAEAGAEFFDPTQIFNFLPREILLDANGADVYEYAPAAFPNFGTMLMEVLRAPGNGDAAHFTPWLAARAGRLGPFTVNPEWGRVPEPRVPLADWLRRWIGLYYSARAADLGVDQSGLGLEFNARLNSNSLLQRGLVSLLELVENFLPGFDHVSVGRAGIGELALALAAMGNNVTACEPLPLRRAAIEAAAAALGKVLPVAEGRLAVAAEFVPERQADDGVRRLFIANELVVPADQQEESLRRLLGYDGILLATRLFLRTRQGAEERAQLPHDLVAAGFRVLREFPYLGLLYAEPIG